MTPSPMTTGRIDVHSHLLPGLDDGCRTVDESIASVILLIGMAVGRLSNIMCTCPPSRSFKAGALPL